MKRHSAPTSQQQCLLALLRYARPLLHCSPLSSPCPVISTLVHCCLITSLSVLNLTGPRSFSLALTHPQPINSLTHPLSFSHSNLWLSQMHLRCPQSTYVGTARLPGYKWIIDTRGYANIVQTSSPSHSPSNPNPNTNTNSTEDEVWGLVYTLTPPDERNLDKNEGVPVAYTKENLTVEFFPASSSPSSSPSSSASESAKRIPALVYIDRTRTAESEPKQEYIYRMNRGIEDALRMGVPEEYVERVLRRFIPDDHGGEGGNEAKQLALKQAGRFREERGGRRRSSRL